MAPKSEKNVLKLTFHHVGIPVTETLSNAQHNSELKMHAKGYFDSPYAIEWMQFDKDNNLPEIIKTQMHVAYTVSDLQKAIAGREVVLAPSSPADGVTVAFILDDGNLIELLQFDKPEQEVWPHPNKFLLECL